MTVDPPLGKYAAQAFADVLSVEWGLSRLALQDGVLDQDEVSRRDVAMSVASLTVVAERQADTACSAGFWNVAAA